MWTFWKHSFEVFAFQQRMHTQPLKTCHTKRSQVSTNSAIMEITSDPVLVYRHPGSSKTALHTVHLSDLEVKKKNNKGKFYH